MEINFNIPVFTDRQQVAGGKPEYLAQPVFFPDFSRSDRRESRALMLLEADLRKHLSERCADARHEVPAAWSFSPELLGEVVRLRLSLRKSHHEVRYFIVRFRQFDRWICFCPKLVQVSFELQRGQVLADRAAEVFSEYFRAQERLGNTAAPGGYSTGGGARIESIDLTCRRRQALPSNSRRTYSSIGGSGEMLGHAELEKVGRNLNRLFPDQLGSAILRGGLVGELKSALTNQVSQRPVMLVGRSQVGKTAIVHQFLRELLTGSQGAVPPGRKQKKRTAIGSVWLLDPQRLISGMAYVGQWEERFLAIVKEVRKRRHVMYIDDVIGYFQAGRTRDSALCLGDLLKAQYEEAPIKLLAETTPEGWRKLREVDRGFADLFKVIRVEEPGEADTIRIAIRTMHELEDRAGVQFSPDVLPLVMDLQRRFMPGRAFPGKAAEFLRQLAGNHPRMQIGARLAREHFQRKTGMATVFLKSSAHLKRAGVEQFFAARIVGQEAARAALADVISLGRGRLNDPARPMASLLFLGPTGVGKTECAKALAEFVFGSAERMLRFDMNEYVGPDGAARLIGFRGRPHGELTNAIRRQPFTVLLLDEVEKAHPAVFDLLLQVLGEGRLTDAAGQTADFCNAVIILTSNLGSQEQRSQVGFRAKTSGDAGIYVKAAENFFRPELFNRLDRVIPFHVLSQEHIAGMAERLARRALDRFGLRQRKLMLDVQPEVFAMLAERGFEPEYGARALRRSVEENLVQPLAEILTKLPPGPLSAVEVGVGAAGELCVEASSFSAPPPLGRRGWAMRAGEVGDLSDRLTAFLARISDELDGWGGGGGYAEQSHYFHLREELLHLRRWRERLLHSAEIELNPQNANLRPRASRFGRRSTRLVVRDLDGAAVLDGLGETGDPGRFLAELAAGAEIIPTLAHHAENLIQRANKLAYFVDHREPETRQQAIRFGGNHPLCGPLEGLLQPSRLIERTADIVTNYIETFGSLPGGEARLDPEDGLAELSAARLIIDLPLIDRFLEFERGSQLIYASDGSRHSLDLDFAAIERRPADASAGTGPPPAVGGEPSPMASVFDSLTVLEELHAREPAGDSEPAASGHLDRADAPSSGEPEQAADAPRGPGHESPGGRNSDQPVVRVHHESGYTLDLRTGIITEDSKTSLWTFINPLLPTAEEFADL